MQRILLSLPFLLLPLLFALPALAGNWGENWGTLTWGAAIAAVPTMGKLGVLVLALGLGGLAARFIQRGRAAASLLVIGLVLSMLSPVANAQTVPNIFTDGTPALASEVNENFQALASAVNASDCATAADVVCNPASVSCPACPSCPAAPACDTLGSFNQGAASVDITIDNETLCTNAGGTYNSGANSCSVDITTDNAAVAAAAGNAACTQAGGTWAPGTSTCSAAPSFYNCFLGGFCAEAAIIFPPATSGYTNVYDGHTSGTEPALGAGCNAASGPSDWLEGSATLEALGETSPLVTPYYLASSMCE